MTYINEKDMLRYYLTLMDADKIVFLKGRTFEKQEIYATILKLIDDESMHDKINTAKCLWKLLFESSMSFIDSDKGGYDQLFDYFDEYVSFEELIFASDSFYRDHTLHCLWVYFLGEYIYHEPKFDFMIGRMFEISTLAEDVYSRCLTLGLSAKVLSDLKKTIESVPDEYSIRCLAALTHDLGYPLKKIKKINGAVKRILPYYGLDKFEEFNFNYQSIQMPFIQSFLDLLSLEINIAVQNPDEIDLNLLAQIYDMKDGKILRTSPTIDEIPTEVVESFFTKHHFKIELAQNTALQLRFSHDFENYQHGIMSAYLIMRNLNVFKNIELIGTSLKDTRFSTVDCKKLFALSEIFKAISHHTTEGFRIQEISQSESFLAFIDEIEEFSRISRANQNREFINEFCKTNLTTEDDFFVINFIFDSEKIDNLDPERAFKGRCKKMLTLFDIPNLEPSCKIKLNCIANLPYDQNTYTLTFYHKYADISINGVSQHIPSYLKSRQFYSTEDYAII